VKNNPCGKETETTDDASASLNSRGDAFIESGMYAEAVRRYEKAIKINPTSSETLDMGLVNISR